MEFKGTKAKWVFNQEEMKIKGSGDIEGLTVIATVSPKMDFSWHEKRLKAIKLIKEATEL